MVNIIDNILHPFNRNHIIETIELTQKRGKKCVVCKSKTLHYSQFSPDYGTFLFCSKKCANKHYRENIYRALPLEKIKNADNKINTSPEPDSK